ncbi:sialic acid-binding Ig-like lectin 10 isoform X1 [Echinops telfairi]|uniref:Sialic acid-binding Ig-like lectin 10 isoform X1 n=1 Tax=Echinops telfairi TaxID=9371 RepID=A0ABM0ZSE8_ECHTE|nr:sialic acid-binding Ig-like lectin 10 isoform X1 [Echinops telfairi]
MLLLLLLPPMLLGGSLAQDWRYTYTLQVQRSATVQEGLCLSIPCTFNYPREGWTHSGPAYGYWFREGTDSTHGFPVATNHLVREVSREARDRFQLLGDPRTLDCSLMIRDARREDTAKYFFRVERGTLKYSYTYYPMSLEVTGLTQKPDVYVPETLEPGRPAKLLCLFPGDFAGCPTPMFSWTGSALSSQGPRPQTSLFFSELTLTPRPQDHNTELTCRVGFSNKGVSAERTIQLRVDHAPKDPVISVSQTTASVPSPQGNFLEVRKGQYLRLCCEADGQPPAMLSWVLNNRVLSMSPPNQSSPLELELPQVGPRDAGRYTCQAENRLGSQQSWLNLSVQYPPENLRVTVSQANRTVLESVGNGSSFPVLEGQSLRLVCAADSSPPAELGWARGRGALSRSAASDPGLLELPRVRKEDEGEVTCRAENLLGAQQVSLHLSVLYPPRLLGPSCSWEPEGLRCSCSVRARPAATLRWRLGTQLVEATGPNASVTVTSSSDGTWANSSLSVRAGLSPDLALHCEARNAHGTHSLTILPLPDDQGAFSSAFSKGCLLGTGIATLLFLCLILILVKILRKKWAQPGALQSRASRGSSVLDYVNVDPSGASRAQNRKVPPSSPFQLPPSGSGLPAESKNPTHPGGIPSRQDPGSENHAEELHYAAVRFPGLRPWEAQEPTDRNTEYAEVTFRRGSAGL